MQLSEKEIEDLIYQDLTCNDGDTLNAKGLLLPFKSLRKYKHHPFENRVHWFRQLNLDPYGVIDIVGFYRHKGVLSVDLLELKAVPIESKDFNQIFRYKKGIEVFTRQTFKDVALNITPILIGHGYDSGCYIQNNCDVIVSELSYGLDGFEFNTHGQFSQWTVTKDDHCNFRSLIKRSTGQKQIAANGQKVYGY